MATAYSSIQKNSTKILLFPGTRSYAIRHKFFLSLFLLLFFQPALFAQNPALRDSVEGNKYDFTQFGNETWSFIKQPTKWDGSDWFKVGVIGAGSFLLIETVDQPARDLALKDRSYVNSVPVEAGRIWGEAYSPVVLFVGFAAHSLITNDNSTRKIAYEIGQACLYTGGIEYVLKTVIGRARPYMNQGKSSYRPFSFSDDYHSFPGGHTAAAFTLSTILSRNAGPTWLKVLVWVPAAITPFSRVYEDKHWVSSCFFGGALGYFIADWVVDLHERNESRVHVSSILPLTISVTLN
jgi:membrane-associated phospholipid phosphatase